MVKVIIIYAIDTFDKVESIQELSQICSSSLTATFCKKILARERIIILTKISQCPHTREGRIIQTEQ